MAQDLAALTNTWMTNPYMFEPSQLSNAYSNYNNAALPYPPTYNTGAGGPVNAATGKPIQSFQQWQQANPAGMSINSTPAAPAAPQAPTPIHGVSGLQPGQWDGANGLPMGNPGGPIRMATGPGGMPPGQTSLGGGVIGQNWQPQPQQAQPAVNGVGNTGAQAGAPPNNWQQAINSLANPGNPVTQGANVPLVQGGQPAGGINQAFLNQAGAGQGMNQNFLNALRSIQARPQL